MTTSKLSIKHYSLAEEIANSVSHGAGVVFGIVALILMLVQSFRLADGLRITTTSIYGLSIIFLFLASTLYHAIPHQGTKRVFQTIDHCAIYLLIAGTYTPFMLLTIGDRVAAIILFVVWLIAIVGIVFKIFFTNRFHNLSLITYLGMGWLGVFAAYEILENLQPIGIVLLVAGGVVYSLGTIFYRMRRIPFNHAIWHLFVLAGCFLHFIAVYFFVLPVTV
ncbi:MAG: hemolysin III family protein [Anaerolineales bacterium]|nr:hemolysin III family protein [Anaerolineales bacterium]